MDPELLEELGLSDDATPEQVRAAIKTREQTAEAKGERKAQASVRKTLALEDDADVSKALTSAASEAADGRAYRADLLQRLSTATICAHGNDEAGQRAAERSKRLFANASISDLRDEVEALEGKVEGEIPNGRSSEEKQKDSTRRATRPAQY